MIVKIYISDGKRGGFNLSCLAGTYAVLLSVLHVYAWLGQLLINAAHFISMIADSLMSSDQMRVVQSPTVRKFLGKKGFLCMAYTGP